MCREETKEPEKEVGTSSRKGSKQLMRSSPLNAQQQGGESYSGAGVHAHELEPGRKSSVLG